MFDLKGLTVVFDLDGTLIDTAPDLIAAVNHVLAKRNLAPIPEHDLRPSISFGGRRMIEIGLETHGHKSSARDVDDLFQTFVAYYSRNIADRSRPFPGLETELERLLGAGATLAVCTNKREDLARQLLHELGLTDRFAAITGRDTFAVHKPHAGHLLQTIEKADGDPATAVMVGDSETDFNTARAANVPFIGVTFGYTDIPITDLACDAVISDYDAFPEALDLALATGIRRDNQ